MGRNQAYPAGPARAQSRGTRMGAGGPQWTRRPRSRRVRAGRAGCAGPGRGGARDPGRATPGPSLTLEGGDERLPILDELLDELVGLLQLGLVGAEPLPELGAVQAALAELQRRQPHAARGRRGREHQVLKINPKTRKFNVIFNAGTLGSPPLRGAAAAALAPRERP